MAAAPTADNLTVDDPPKAREDQEPPRLSTMRKTPGGAAFKNGSVESAGSDTTETMEGFPPVKNPE